MYNIKTSVIMKNLMNFSKLAITALITSSLFVACGEEISETTCDTQYTANTGNVKNAGIAVDLGLPSGTKWANMNVGATSESDNGVLFVWGDATGSQLMAKDLTSYTNVTDQTSVEKLFEMYKGAENDGVVSDTTTLAIIAEAKLINTTSVTDAEIRETILAFVEAKLDDAKSKNTEKGTFVYEATLKNNDFDLIVNLDGDMYIERLPNIKEVLKLDHNPAAQDTIDYYKKYVYEKETTLSIDRIGSKSVKYYNSWLANNYADVKDQFGVLMRKDYTGGDIGSAPKDRLDDKKKDNLTFVPAYSIVKNANHDPATANWGGNWRMPTTADFVELLEYCEWEFVGNGYKVTSKVEGNNNSIFLPAAGYRYGDQWYGNGNAGYYATGEIIGTYHFPSMADQLSGSKGELVSTENMPNMLIFQHGQYNSLDIYNNLSTSFGVSVRPVTD